MRFKVGDRVRIKSLDWYKIQCMDYNYVIIDFMNHKWCGYEMTIVETDEDFYYMKEDEGLSYWTDEMIEGLVEEPITLNGKEVLLKLADIKLPSGRTDIWECPKGYQFVDENGNVINATKIVLEKKKKEYPKTFRECQGYLGEDVLPMEEPVSKTHRRRQVHLLEVLLICRDAYWKIAGEEMGLDGPWEPDWNDGCYVIFTKGDGLIERDIQFGMNAILAFPTEEMCDEFYEAFKKEIEICKEFL